MPGAYCVAYNCSNRGGFRFPKNEKIKKKWITAIRRKNITPSMYSMVCKDHFMPSDFIKENAYGIPLLIHRLKPGSVPSVFKLNVDKEHKTQATKNRQYLASKRKVAEEEILRKRDEERDEAIKSVERMEVEIALSPPAVDASQNIDFGGTRDSGCQTMHKGPIAHFRITIDHLLHNQKYLHVFTGLETAEKIFLVYNSLEIDFCPEVDSFKNCKLSIHDQFLMVLIKFRLYQTNTILAFYFNISESLVSKLLRVWINFMYRVWSQVNLWPSKSLIKYHIPKDFKRKFPDTRVILDGMEIPIQRASNCNKQSASFSTYKNRNTLKTILGCSPSGMITYISNTYGGSASDRQIIERSDLMSKCEPGDSVMDDKGFDVQDVFAPYGVTVNIPTFMTGKNQLSGLTVKRDRKIASKRVHIERVIGLVKTYKILRGPLNRFETEIGHEIIYISCMLCNFRSNIVSSFA